MKERIKFLGKVKDKLLKRRQDMTDQLSTIASEKVSDGQVQDSGDEALALSMEKLKTSLEQTEIDELRRIDDCLQRIEKGEYGFCIDCSNAISAKRLETFPYVARCIVCQEVLETAS